MERFKEIFKNEIPENIYILNNEILNEKPSDICVKATIEKELKHAVNLRSACQVANLGVSLVLLGLIIPIFTRNQTKRSIPGSSHCHL